MEKKKESPWKLVNETESGFRIYYDNSEKRFILSKPDWSVFLTQPDAVTIAINILAETPEVIIDKLVSEGKRPAIRAARRVIQQAKIEKRADAHGEESRIILPNSDN